MKILIISPTPSHPQNAGNRQRIHALMQRLKQYGHELHFCFVRREWVDEESLQAMGRCWDRFTTIDYNRKLERKTKGETFGIDDWFPPQLEEEFAKLALAEAPDVVMVEYVFLSKALDFFPASCLKIIDTHDVFADRHLRLESVGLEASFFYTTADEEAAGLNRADIVLAIQDEERGRLQELTTASVITVGFAPRVERPEVPLHMIAPAKGRKGQPRASGAERSDPASDEAGNLSIGYLGSGNLLNVQAVQRFLGALDSARMEAGGARICIGGGTSAALGELPGFAERVGAVDDLGRFYGTLHLAINPHEGGTGLKIKTVEALAHGLPVIGTTEAFLGLEPEAAFHSASSAAEVGRFVLRYVQDPGFRAEVTEASRQVRERYMAAVDRQLGAFKDLDTLRSVLKRPRVLFITDIAFWQECLGNHARMAEQIRAARASMDVDVLVFRTLSEDDHSALQAIVGGRGRVFSFKDYIEPTFTQALWLEASSDLTGFERKSFSRQYFAALEAHLAQHGYDAYILQYIRLSYLRHAKGLPALSVIDIHDVMSMRIENFAWFGMKHFMQISDVEEMKILGSFRLILAIQAFEYNYLNSLFPGRVIYFPHILSDVARREPAEQARRIIFVGGNSPMNRDGVCWFLEQVWPCFQNREVEFHVAGDVCQALPEGLPGVVLHGRIDDLRGFLRTGDIAINPVFYGGGLKIKTVEYLCYGIPSVLTLEAVFGIPGGDGQAYLLATSRAEFIEALDKLLDNSGARQVMAEKAFEFGRRRFAARALVPGISVVTALALSQRDAA